MKKMRKRTKFVIAAMANIIWYTVAVLILSAKDKTVPDGADRCVVWRMDGGTRNSLWH